jgi:hypothetical protein
MPFKKLGFILLLTILSGKSFSQQQTADIGIFVGGATPITDFSNTNLFKSVNFDFGGFYRYNFNSRFSLRINALYGKVGAVGSLNLEPQKFKKSVFDFGTFIEINYLDYIVGVKKMRFSPFVYTGLGLSYYPNEQGKGTITPNIPLGLGVKYALTDKLSMGAEASLRKLFNDGLDNLNNPYQEVGLEKVSDILHNNDWISYFGLTLSYKFYWGRKPCPAYESIN